MAILLNVNHRPAGMSDEDQSDQDEDLYLDFGVKKTSQIKRKRRKINTTPAPKATTSKGLGSKAKNLSFWDKKALAFKRYEEATVRPQENYRDFLLHRRQLNNGLWNAEWHKRDAKTEQAIQESKYFPPSSGLTLKAIPPLYNNNFQLVNDSSSFEAMLQALRKETDFSLDLEGNDDHSFLGMTVLIQVGTRATDYIIDCFPVTSVLLNEFKVIIEDNSIIKWVFGCDNDVQWLKRDYLAQLTSAIDVQVLFKEILEAGYFDDATKLIPKQVKDKWYSKYVGSKSSFNEKTAAKSPFSFEKIAELFYPSCEIDKVAQVADFRPRDSDDPTYKKLLKYARDDVHVLLKIVDVLSSSITDRSIFTKAFDATKKKELRNYVRKVHTEVAWKNCGRTDLTDSGQSLFRMIMTWREHHAKIIDENPDYMFTAKILVNLINTPPKIIEHLQEAVKQRRGDQYWNPESLDTFDKTLFNLLTDGESYHKKIMSMQCHNCRQVVGHAAWGCPLPWSIQSTKQNLREDDESRSRQNHRRQVNKRLNKQKQKNME